MDDWHHTDTGERSGQVMSTGLDLAQTYLPYCCLRVLCIRPVEAFVSDIVYMETLYVYICYVTEIISASQTLKPVKYIVQDDETRVHVGVKLVS
jgi:hypothetical protein